MNSIRNALVTGGSGGVGSATCRLLASRGYRVHVNDLDAARVDQTVEDLHGIGPAAVAAPFDVTDEAGVSEAIDDLADRFGPFHALINNAGAWKYRSFDQTTAADWEFDIALNFRGVLNCTHAALRHMTLGEGRIISVVSEAARTGEKNTAVYAGAKAAVIGFSKSLAKEVGSSGVTVNCVSLAATVTPAHGGALDDPDRAARVVRAYPLGRLGDPEDAAAAIDFLASEGASWITGQTLGVNGGYAMI